MERFWSKVDKSGDCWEWTGRLNYSGYGMFYDGSRVVRAHRLSWTLHFGQIEGDMYICHKCDNRKCVRPDHLFQGTAKDNAQDRERKCRNNHVKGSKIGTAKLSDESVQQIRQLAANGNTQKEIARRFGVDRSTVGYVIRGNTWKDV